MPLESSAGILLFYMNSMLPGSRADPAYDLSLEMDKILALSAVIMVMAELIG